jgi:GT2 family glycosyltransferase
MTAPSLNVRSPWKPECVSVIIKAYNGADTLGEQLDALSAQSYNGEWEIVVADNRSTDRTADLVKDYQRRLPNLRLVSALEKQDRAYAANYGASRAGGDVFLFTDQDDVVAPGWIAALTTALQRFDVAAGAIDVERLNRHAPWRPKPFVNGQRALDFLPFAIGTNLGVRREAFEAVGGYSDRYPTAQDIDLCWRLQLHGYRLGDAPDALVYYRYKETTAEMLQQIVRYAEDHVNLYAHFARYGMPRSSLRAALRKYWDLLSEAPFLFFMVERDRVNWLRKLAACWGRVRGSIRYRRLYL